MTLNVQYLYILVVAAADWKGGDNREMSICKQKILSGLNETLAQFHQRSTSSFNARRSQKHKNSVKLSVSFLCFWDLCAQKLRIKWWWNWRLGQPWLIFTNNLHVAFTSANPKIEKKTDSLTVFFCAFGICVNKSLA